MALRRTVWMALSLLMFLTGTLRVHAITCQKTEYKVEEQCCPMCSAGFRVKSDCSAFNSTTCLPCLDGTFMDMLNGLKKCHPCSVCDAGSGLKIRENCTLRSDTVCEPLEGFFCSDGSSENCAAAQQHRLCEPGQFISTAGTSSSDTQCSDCGRGTFSNGSLAYCLPHRVCEAENLQLMRAGTDSDDAECGEKMS